MNLTQLRGKCVDQIRSLHEGASGREWTDDEQAKFDALSAQVEDIDARLQSVEAMEPRSTGRRATASMIATRDQGADSALLRSWLRAGTALETGADRDLLSIRGVSPSAFNLEFRAQSKTATAGLELVPTSLFSEVSKTLAAFAPVRRVARVITTTAGETLKIPTVDDSANVGAIVSENSLHAEQDIAFSDVQLGAFTYSSKIIRVSNELLQDSAIDLAAFLGATLGERIGRAQAAHFLTGTGSGQPQGLITAAGTVSAGSATALAASDLVNLVAAVDPAWLDDGASGSVGWMMHPTIYGLIRKLADSAGNPLVQPLTDRGPANLLGYPVILTPGMASSTVATAKTILFGNFNQYLIRDAGTLSVLRSNERYFEYNQSAFIALYRTDAKVLQANAIKVLLH